MGRLGIFLITLSGLSPSIAVFIVGSDVIRQVGSGVVDCFAAAACFGVLMAFVYGELGSAFPGSGGEYTILGEVFGPLSARGVLGLNLLGFSISLALSGFGAATYLGVVLPGLPARPLAAAMVVAVSGIAVLNIRIGALVTGGFLVLEFAALAVLTALGAAGAHGHAHLLFEPTLGGGAAPSLAALGAGTVAAIYAFNGYGAAIFFGEDMRDARGDVAPVVLWALLSGVAIVVPPIAGVIWGTRDLGDLVAAPAPISAFVEHVGGAALARAMGLGVALAIVNTMIAIALMAGRQLYATGRDGLWPPRLSRGLAAIHARRGSPWIATLVMGGCGLLACLLDPHTLLLVLGNGNVVTYSALCLAVLQARRTRASREGNWRMPGFPLPPLLCLLFLATALVADLFDSAGRIGLLVTVATIAASLVVLPKAGRRPATP